MKFLTLIAAAALSFSAVAKPLKFKAQDIKGQVKLLIDMDQISEPVDILFVVDNSASMMTYQNTVVANANAFMQALSAGGTDWRLALISTTILDAPFVGMAAGDELNSSTANGAGKFSAAVAKLGVDGDVNESPFATIQNALTANPAFLRPDAKLAIILITDTIDQSKATTADFIKDLVAKKGGDVAKISFYGFLNPVEWCSPTNDSFNWKGSKFEELLNTVGGEAKSLCGSDFGANISKLGTTLSESSNKGKGISEIPLPSLPDSATITVNFGTQVIEKGVLPQGWIYNSTSNMVLLGDQIPWSTQPFRTPLEVTYTPKDWVK